MLKDSDRSLYDEIIKLAVDEEDKIPEGFEESEIISEPSPEPDSLEKDNKYRGSLENILKTLNKKAFVNWCSHLRQDSFSVSTELEIAIAINSSNRAAYQASLKMNVVELAKIVEEMKRMPAFLSLPILAKLGIKLPSELFLHLSIGMVLMFCILSLNPDMGYPTVVSDNYESGISRIRNELSFEELMIKLDQPLNYNNYFTLFSTIGNYADPEIFDRIYGANTFENWIAIHKKLPSGLCGYNEWYSIKDQEGNHLC
jgi:hypothetical protein